MRNSRKPNKQKSNEHKSNTKNEREEEQNKNTRDESNKEDSPELKKEFENLLEQFHALEKKQKEEIVSIKKNQASLQIFIETVYATKEEVKSSICLNMQTTIIFCNSIIGEDKCTMLADFYPKFGCVGETEAAE